MALIAITAGDDGTVLQPNLAFTTPTITGGTINGTTMTGSISNAVKRCTTQTDATSNTTLADITGLTGISLVAGATYAYEIRLSGTAGASGGWKVAFNYTTATLTSLQSQSVAFSAAAVVTGTQVTTTTTQTSLIASTAAHLAGIIYGTLVVNAAGTLAVQFAQNASNATASSIYVGSTASFTRIS